MSSISRSEDEKLFTINGKIGQKACQVLLLAPDPNRAKQTEQRRDRNRTGYDTAPTLSGGCDEALTPSPMQTLLQAAMVKQAG